MDDTITMDEAVVLLVKEFLVGISADEEGVLARFLGLHDPDYAYLFDQEPPVRPVGDAQSFPRFEDE